MYDRRIGIFQSFQNDIKDLLNHYITLVNDKKRFKFINYEFFPGFRQFIGILEHINTTFCRSTTRIYLWLCKAFDP